MEMKNEVQYIFYESELAFTFDGHIRMIRTLE